LNELDVEATKIGVTRTSLRNVHAFQQMIKI